jgi:CHASE2 domain-containing sensor protein
MCNESQNAPFRYAFARSFTGIALARSQNAKMINPLMSSFTLTCLLFFVTFVLFLVVNFPSALSAMSFMDALVVTVLLGEHDRRILEQVMRTVPIVSFVWPSPFQGI